MQPVRFLHHFYLGRLMSGCATADIATLQLPFNQNQCVAAMRLQRGDHS
jgi:hypothetical protein